MHRIDDILAEFDALNFPSHSPDLSCKLKVELLRRHYVLNEANLNNKKASSSTVKNS